MITIIVPVIVPVTVILMSQIYLGIIVTIFVHRLGSESIELYYENNDYHWGC
jgi:hypothetical protein